SIRTADNPDSLNLNKGTFALQTQKVRSEDNPLLFLWGDGERMMTISSAETYFAPPSGRDESPNQYSPFWDARLREPSQVVQFMASGKIDLRKVLGLDNISPSAVSGFMLGLATDHIIKPGRDRLLEKLPAVIKPVVKPVIEEVTDSVLDKAVEGIGGALDSYAAP